VDENALLEYWARLCDDGKSQAGSISVSRWLLDRQLTRSRLLAAVIRAGILYADALPDPLSVVGPIFDECVEDAAARWSAWTLERALDRIARLAAAAAGAETDMLARSITHCLVDEVGRTPQYQTLRTTLSTLLGRFGPVGRLYAASEIMSVIDRRIASCLDTDELLPLRQPLLQ